MEAQAKAPLPDDVKAMMDVLRKRDEENWEAQKDIDDAAIRKKWGLDDEAPTTKRPLGRRKLEGLEG